jgi:hypothetical protein
MTITTKIEKAYERLQKARELVAQGNRIFAEFNLPLG